MAKGPRKTAAGQSQDVDVVSVNEEEIVGALLTAGEKAAIEAEVDAEVSDEQYEIESAKYRAELKRKKRVAAGLARPQEKVTLNLPGHADRITLDGKEFHHAHTYLVADHVAEQLRDIEFCAWKHEWATGGANMNLYRKPRNTQTGSPDAAQLQAELRPSVKINSVGSMYGR